MEENIDKKDKIDWKEDALWILIDMSLLISWGVARAQDLKSHQLIPYLLNEVPEIILHRFTYL